MPDDTTSETGQSKATVFISYSRKDIAFADRLDAALMSRGFEPVIDRTDIYAFEEWWKRIEALIARADTVVFVLSPDAVASDVALKEVTFAASLNKRFAPIVYRRVDDKQVPEALAKLNFIFFDEDASQFEQSVDRLAEALNADIGWIRQHTEYGEAERRWSAAGRPTGLLLHSPTLEVAEHWVSSRPRGAPEPTAQILAFVTESRKRARVSQRIWRLVLATTFTFMAATILSLIGWINQSYIADQWRWWTVTRPYMVSQVRPYVVSTAKEQGLRPGDSFKECAQNCPGMIVVTAGSFTMGSPTTDKGPNDNESPQHQVTIAKSFAVSKYELTFAEWDTCVAYGDCAPRPQDLGWGRGQQPVIYVSWDDAQQYAAWLSKLTGKPYRLLSEAEYEYAARAGTQTAYPWGDDVGKNNASCKGCGSKWDYTQTAPVGSFAKNAFGLYDMVGNVWEWVEDCYHPGYEVQTPQGKVVDAPADGSAWTGGDCGLRVIRGGSWSYSPEYLRSATRFGFSREFRSSNLGFRIARTLSAGAGAITVAPGVR
jgi:formylglycine-generating enzyme required for sulfatase activity